MYAALQTVNLWSPNPIQYNLVSYKSLKESTTNCSAAAGRGALLVAWQCKPCASQGWPISLRCLHSLCSAHPAGTQQAPPTGCPEPPLLLVKCLELPGRARCGAINSTGPSPAHIWVSSSHTGQATQGGKGESEKP